MINITDPQRKTQYEVNCGRIESKEKDIQQIKNEIGEFINQNVRIVQEEIAFAIIEGVLERMSHLDIKFAHAVYTNPEKYGEFGVTFMEYPLNKFNFQISVFQIGYQQLHIVTNIGCQDEFENGVYKGSLEPNRYWYSSIEEVVDVVVNNIVYLNKQNEELAAQKIKQVLP